MTAEPPIRVLFLAGTGRCGSTILSSMLGQVPGCLAAGELRYLWDRGIRDDNLCGCGVPFSRCVLWSSVLEAFPQGFAPDGARVADSIQRRLRVRLLPLMLWRRMQGHPMIPARPEDICILRLYQTLSRLIDTDVIVDSSKLPLYAMLLSALPGVDIRVVHIVRDPRATAFSWRRKKLSRDSTDQATMAQMALWRSAVLWLLWTLLSDRWWPLTGARSTRIRYEDLVAEPERTLEQVLQLIDKPLPAGLIVQHQVMLQQTHSVAGNPNRHDSGLVLLKPDDEWLTAMSAPQRFLVTILTLPGLRRFGYKVWPQTVRGFGRDGAT
jgi:hypothetical protein